MAPSLTLRKLLGYLKSEFMGFKYIGGWGRGIRTLEYMVLQIF